MIVGGATPPPGLIVNVAGTRALTDAVVPVVVVGVVWVSVTVVSVAVVRLVVVSGGVVSGVVCVGELEVDFEPPQPATSNAPRRTGSRLTFAG
jgi:hypothetical protein